MDRILDHHRVELINLGGARHYECKPSCRRKQCSDSGQSHTAVKREARAQFPPKLSLNKVLNFQKFSFSRTKLSEVKWWSVTPACNFLFQYNFYNILLQKPCRFSLQTLAKFEAAKTGSGVDFLQFDRWEGQGSNTDRLIKTTTPLCHVPEFKWQPRQFQPSKWAQLSVSSKMFEMEEVRGNY